MDDRGLGWVFWFVMLFALCVILLSSSEKQKSELRDLQRRIAVLEQKR